MIQLSNDNPNTTPSVAIDACRRAVSGRSVSDNEDVIMAATCKPIGVDCTNTRRTAGRHRRICRICIHLASIASLLRGVARWSTRDHYCCSGGYARRPPPCRSLTRSLAAGTPVVSISIPFVNPIEADAWLRSAPRRPFPRAPRSNVSNCNRPQAGGGQHRHSPRRPRAGPKKRASCAASGTAEASFLTGCAIARCTSLALATVHLNH